MTPAMKAGLVRKPWSVADLLREAEARGPVAVTLPAAA